jgi:para-nitrobenzyl esterase
MRRPRVRSQALGLLLAAAAAAACGGEKPAPPVADGDSRRTTPSGEIVGFVGRYGSHVWLGIPFAKPPVGPLRWRAPQPNEPWAGVREALAHGSICTQRATPLGGVEGDPGEPVGSEDCLYLNVYAPRTPAAGVPGEGKRLPVMFWIHGGGNSVGHSGFYDGGQLAQTQNVIVVTTNYRLGPLGWFRHAALRAEVTTAEEQSGNFATLDLVRGLEWVRDHIAAFGGDPGNVTVFGESAGGRNTVSMLLSPRAHGLFHRAIVQSGGIVNDSTSEAESWADAPQPGHRNSGNEVVARLLVREGRAKDRGEARAALASMPAAEVSALMRRTPAPDLFLAYALDSEEEGMIDFPNLFRDGVVLPDADTLEVFAKRGAYNEVPVIFGTNRDENKLFLFVSPQWVKRWFGIIPRVRDESLYQASAEHLAQSWKITGADEPAAVLRRTQGPSVFAYRFDWDEEPSVLGSDLQVMIGASHGFEIPFVFGHFDLGREGNVVFDEENAPGRLELSARMMSYWAQFAATGAPGRGRDGKLPEWAPWDDSAPAAPKYLVLDTDAGGGIRMASETVTREQLLAAVDADPRLTEPRDRCDVYWQLATWGRMIAAKDYPTIGANGCREFPFEGYPWAVGD